MLRKNGTVVYYTLYVEDKKTMIGLSLLAALIVFLIFSVGIVLFVTRWAKDRGKNPFLWGALVAILMYNLLFWDLIPTIVVHKYYCDKKAGFWVYKTVQQWKKENPGVAETLEWIELSPSFENQDGSRGYNLNQRFNWEMRRWYTPLLPLSLSTDSIIDLATGEIMVKRVKVGVGKPRGIIISELDLWKWRDSYIPNVNEFSKHYKSFKQLGNEVK